jgi:16S rRNA processing protein RimM
MRKKQPEPRYLALGRIQRPHGVRGEVRLEILTDYPERLSGLKTVFLGSEHRAYQVENCRLHQKIALVKLAGLDDRDSADQLRGKMVHVAIEDAVPLEGDEHYEFQMEGVQVVTDAGQVLGEIVEVFTAPGANDVFIVHGPLGEILIPVIEDVVTDLDLDAGRLVIHPLPGLLDGK